MIRPREGGVSRTRSEARILAGRNTGTAIVPSNNGANIRGDVRARVERLSFMRISVVIDRLATVPFRIGVCCIGGLAKRYAGLRF